ncbi:MAG TPA: OmpA family protein [Vicinamibacteria bacterium]|nr:OmpA family protein [Vicinamibacteria bacterium]
MTDRDETESRGPNRSLVLGLVVLLLLLLAASGYLGFRILHRLEAIEQSVATANDEARLAREAAEDARARAETAEYAARAASEGRARAEVLTERAREDATQAREDAETAQIEADTARAEAERIRQEAEAELKRLEESLSKIAETRRTALGLVMNLGEDSLKFDFDKAEIRPENRELLSRIAGVLMTSSDFTVSVNGHTDDVGTAEYNQKLSERRANAVHDYLVKAGVPAEIMTVHGWGKTKPLVEGKSEAARGKNRRVELGIVNSRVNYRDRVTEKR